MQHPIQVVMFFVLTTDISIIWRLKLYVMYLFDCKYLKDRDLAIITINYSQGCWTHNTV